MYRRNYSNTFLNITDIRRNLIFKNAYLNLENVSFSEPYYFLFSLMHTYISLYGIQLFVKDLFQEPPGSMYINSKGISNYFKAKAMNPSICL